MRRPQLPECAPLEGESRNSRERCGFCASWATIEHRDLAEEIAGFSNLEAQFPAVACGDCQTNLPRCDQVELRARIAASEQHLPLRKSSLAKLTGAGSEIVGRESLEKRRCGEKLDNTVARVFARHGKIILHVWANPVCQWSAAQDQPSPTRTAQK